MMPSNTESVLGEKRAQHGVHADGWIRTVFWLFRGFGFCPFRE